MKEKLTFLGIETSCDETAASVVREKADGTAEILSNIVSSQIEEHKEFGGVVPEIAARAHVEKIEYIINKAIKDSNLSLSQIDGVAATAGPGLIVCLTVGLNAGKAIAGSLKKPFIAVNHLEGHALSPKINEKIEFPYLLLLISGGHTQFLEVNNINKYKRLGTTIDDALGEAFDKTAKMLGLGYPGGPPVEKMAAKGDPNRFKLPRPMKGRAGCDFSFSGLKTKVRQTIEALPPGNLKHQDIADLCASFQQAAGDVLADRCENALDIFLKLHPTGGTLVVAGGVAANMFLRERLEILASMKAVPFAAPPAELCTDNGAMVAWTGLEKLRLGETDSLAFRPRPRWPLDPKAQRLLLLASKLKIIVLETAPCKLGMFCIILYLGGKTVEQTELDAPI